MFQNNGLNAIDAAMTVVLVSRHYLHRSSVVRCGEGSRHAVERLLRCVEETNLLAASSTSYEVVEFLHDR